MLPPVPGVMLVVPGQHWGWFHLPERWDWGGNEEFYSKSSIPWGLLVTEIPFPSLVSMGAVWRCFVPTTRHCQGWGFFFWKCQPGAAALGRGGVPSAELRQVRHRALGHRDTELSWVPEVAVRGLEVPKILLVGQKWLENIWIGPCGLLER